MTQEQFKALDPKVASHREELLRSQQGELDAVLMYQRLAKVVKTDKEREAFLQLAKEEGRHASVFHCLYPKGFETQENDGSNHAYSLLSVRQEAPL